MTWTNSIGVKHESRGRTTEATRFKVLGGHQLFTLPQRHAYPSPLIIAIYPLLERANFTLSFIADRLDHADLSGMRLPCCNP